jgi:8-oxo-dGTP pyrophosphatase MutT (NUDIX family)
VPEKTKAGGVVARVEDGRVMIAIVEKPLKVGVRFSLPKGGLKAGETPEEAAQREISEETGITDLRLVRFLAETERTNIKRSRWNVNRFYLFVTDQIDCVSQEKDKTLRWFSIDDLPRMYWPDQDELLKSHRQEIIDLVL